LIFPLQFGLFTIVAKILGFYLELKAIDHDPPKTRQQANPKRLFKNYLKKG
jgi:hypothetical protein